MAWGLGQTMGRLGRGWSRPGLGRDVWVGLWMLGGLVLKTSNLSPCPVPLVKSEWKEHLGSGETPNLAQFSLEGRRVWRLEGMEHKYNSSWLPSCGIISTSTGQFMADP